MEEQIIKWLLDEKRGVISPDHSREVSKWRSESAANEQLYQDYWKLLNSPAYADAGMPDINLSWDDFSQKIPQSVSAPVGHSLRSVRFWLPRVAALLVVAAGAWYFLNPGDTPSEWIAIADPIELGLKDGTEVILRSDSKLRLVNPGRWDQERRVQLIGEAFFDVASDAKRPFLVEAGDLLIRVMGTSFSVAERPEEDLIEVLVNSGKVGVHLQGTTEPVLLGAGDLLTWNAATSQSRQVRTSTANLLSWHSGVLTFSGTPLAEVCRDLSRHYQVDIRVTEKLAACRFTSRFDNTSLEDVLEILRHTFDLTIKPNPDGGYRLDGVDCG